MDFKSIEYINELAASGQKFIFLIDFEMNQIVVLRENEWTASNIFFETPILTHLPAEIPIKKNIALDILDTDRNEYIRRGSIIKDAILGGESYLLNYTESTAVSCSFSLMDIFVSSKSLFKIFYKDQFVCFSPERFVKINDDFIKAYPMKGTIDATIPDAKNKILNDIKETTEHNTIIDLIRNDLSIIATDVSVEQYRYITEIKSQYGHLLQVSSEIKGRMPEDWRDRLGSLIIQLLPAGSISGAPKKRTLEIIQQTENHQRGFYTGIFGLFDGQSFDSAVMIRFIERVQSTHRLVYKSGGGITALSDIEAEYYELLQKIYVPTF